MNLRHLFCVGTVAALLGAAAQFADARVNVDLTVGIPPPPVVVEPLPPPMPHYVWVPGYWGWDGHGYVWVPGYWDPGAARLAVRSAALAGRARPVAPPSGTLGALRHCGCIRPVLRHTWASRHVQDGTPLFALPEIRGWQSPEMVRRYAHWRRIICRLMRSG
jgi:hypothetical protein